MPLIPGSWQQQQRQTDMLALPSGLLCSPSSESVSPCFCFTPTFLQIQRSADVAATQASASATAAQDEALAAQALAIDARYAELQEEQTVALQAAHAGAMAAVKEAYQAMFAKVGVGYAT